MFIKSQDIVVALKLTLGGDLLSYAELGHELGMSASEAHAAVRRLNEARLVEPESKIVRREALMKFLVHGVPYAFPARTKEVTRGMPTAWAVPALANKFQDSGQLPPVWPAPDGIVQGVAVKPLYPSVPDAAQRDPALYEMLSLVDAIRIGRARERQLAEKELSNHLKSHATA